MLNGIYGGICLAAKKYEIDMSSGSLVKSIIAFVIPLMLSNILQLLYNAADIIVVGQFTGKEALAAVGSTGPLINLLTNLFIGLSVGTSVLISTCYGAGDREGVHKGVHTSVILSFIGGILCLAVGVCFARPLLLMMGSPEDVIDMAVLYMTIYFIGAPASIFYNFGSAILRAYGDTKRPLFILTVTGLVNVALNLIFVLGFHMGVEGVAIATITAQYLSALMLGWCLMTSNEAYRLSLKELKVHKDQLLAILRVGLPAGIQSCVFSISNVIIQSSINSFGSVVIAGNSAAGNIEGFIYTAMNSIHHATVTATAQNMGAKKKDRVYKSLRVNIALVVAVGLVLGILVVLFREQLLSIYSSDPEVIAAGARRNMIIGSTYFLCGMMEVYVGHLRGMGYSLVPTIVSIVGVCGVRIVWVYTVFAMFRSVYTLYAAWTVSWLATAAIHYICILFVRRRAIAKAMQGVEA